VTDDQVSEFKQWLALVLVVLCVVAAIVLGGCDERGQNTPVKRHCNVLYERGHAQPCRP